jgi:hypothetical protein
MKTILIILLFAVSIQAQSVIFHWAANGISLQLPEFLVYEEGEEETPVFVSPGLKLFLYNTEMPYVLPEDELEWTIITSFYFELEDVEPIEVDTKIETHCLSGIQEGNRAIVCYFQGTAEGQLCFIYLEFDEDDWDMEFISKEIVESMNKY